MRVSTKLGLYALATWLVLGALAAGVAPPPQWPEDILARMYFVTKLEATASVQWLSAASLATGVIAMAYSGCELIGAAYRRLGESRKRGGLTPFARRQRHLPNG